MSQPHILVADLREIMREPGLTDYQIEQRVVSRLSAEDDTNVEGLITRGVLSATAVLDWSADHWDLTVSAEKEKSSLTIGSLRVKLTKSELAEAIESIDWERVPWDMIG